MGGTGFYSDDRLIVGVVREALCVRVSEEGAEPHITGSEVGPFLFAGRPVTGWLSIEGEPLDDTSLAAWVEVAETGWRVEDV